MPGIFKPVVLVCLCLLNIACKPLVNHFAFYPDQTYILPDYRLPKGLLPFSIKSEDNIGLVGLYIKNPDAENIVLYFHGNAGNIYHRIPTLMQLQDYGVSVIGLSYRGYGRSEGSPSEQGIYMDGEALVKHVTQVLGYKHENIILFGRSIGSTVAVHLAQQNLYKALILVTPLSNAKQQARASGLSLFASFADGVFDNLAKIEKNKAPLLIVHGTRDSIIPVSMGKALFDKANSPKVFAKVEGANHNNLQGAYAHLYWPPIKSFIATINKNAD